jgi:hypothetical protein
MMINKNVMTPEIVIMEISRSFPDSQVLLPSVNARTKIVYMVASKSVPNQSIGFSLSRIDPRKKSLVAR